MEFTKTHLSYEGQVRLMADRGMEVGEWGDAIRAVKRIGYYRLSAYTYPMRTPAAEPPGAHAPTELDPLASRRDDQFLDGSKLSDAVALHDFDHRFRRVLLAGLQELEIGVRTKVAYHLSKHEPMAHLTQSGLSRRLCDEPVRGPDHTGTRYESWRREYDSLQGKAKHEEYVKHFLMRYDGAIPIWAAGEFMTMGCLIALFKLMIPRDARRIAQEFGVKNQDILHGWLKALNVMRNHCAHGARIWNRSTTYPPTALNTSMVDDGLHHLVGADTNKVYFLAAVTAYLLRRVNQESRFGSDFKTAMKKFPVVQGMTPENTMGFTPNWRDEALWGLP